MDGYKAGSGTFRMNVALSELPDFTVLPGKEKAEHHTAGIIISPTLDYMDRPIPTPRQFGWSKEPIVEMKLPTSVDDSLAPPGPHRLALLPAIRAGAAGRPLWDDEREAAADVIIDTVTRHAPNFRKSIIATQIHSPSISSASSA
jgi:phytoene dehydrogenase-like protein